MHIPIFQYEFLVDKVKFNSACIEIQLNKLHLRDKYLKFKTTNNEILFLVLLYFQYVCF